MMEFVTLTNFHTFYYRTKKREEKKKGIMKRRIILRMNILAHRIRILKFYPGIENLI